MNVAGDEWTASEQRQRDVATLLLASTTVGSCVAAKSASGILHRHRVTADQIEFAKLFQGKEVTGKETLISNLYDRLFLTLTGQNELLGNPYQSADVKNKQPSSCRLQTFGPPLLLQKVADMTISGYLEDLTRAWINAICYLGEFMSLLSFRKLFDYSACVSLWGPRGQRESSGGGVSLLLHPEFDDSAQLSHIETESPFAGLVEA
ncbi:hypothetical protein LXL04_000932 [Taraxacum kok-saghyz]